MKPPVSSSDIERIIGLLGKIAGGAGGPGKNRVALIWGLCELVEADAWMWTVIEPAQNGAGTAYSIPLHGGFDDAQFAALLKAQEHPESPRLSAAFFDWIHRLDGPVTRLLEEFGPPARIRAAKAFEICREVDVEAVMVSAYPNGNGTISAVKLFRRSGRQDFTRRESRIVQLLFSQIPWLHQFGEPVSGDPDPAPPLSPRNRTVLNLLLQGNTRKEIAAELDLSIHTVGGYAKEIYSRYQVNSHVGLIRRLLGGEAAQAG